MAELDQDPVRTFELEKDERIRGYPEDAKWQVLSRGWMRRAFEQKYMYNFSWMGRPIIQTPVDMVAMQELIWQVKPDLIIETGIAHGGSLIMYASMLALIDYSEAVEFGKVVDPKITKRHVLGIDIDIRAHNQAAIEAHPMAHRIEMIQGSSIDSEVVSRVRECSKGYERVMVVLDSNHTHDHVLAELEAYGSLVSKGSYCVVFDTVVEDLPKGMFKDRPWDRGNNPKTAVWEYLKALSERKEIDAQGLVVEFEIDKEVQNKLLLTAALDGYLRRI